MLKQEENELMEEIQKAKAALKEEEATCNYLKQQTDVRQSHNTHGHLQPDPWRVQ